MITLCIDLGNRTEYQVYNSLWAANLIAWNLIEKNPQIIRKIHIMDSITGEVYKTYVNGIDTHIVSLADNLPIVECKGE